MSKTSGVTIVIPAFNEANQLGQCLQSIAAQSRPPAAVIVVNNNSTDNTAKIVHQFPFAKLINEKNQGIVYARNAGFNAVRTSVIARIDADTNLAPEWVATAQALASKLAPGDAITGPCYFRDTRFPRLVFAVHRLVYFWSSRLLLGHTTLFGSNMLIGRQTWLDIRKDTCTDNRIHEDMDLAFHLVKRGGNIHFCKELKASISTRRWRDGWHYPRMWLKTRTIHRH